MNIAQRWAHRSAATAWMVSMILLLSGCIAENLEDCPQPFSLTVRALDASGRDITSEGDVQEVILFTFDETGKCLAKQLLNADEVKARKQIYVKHLGPKKLTFVAWGNPTAADIERLKSVQRIEEVSMPLTVRDGYGEFPPDLFSGRLDRDQTYGGLDEGHSATIDIYRRTCQVTVTVLGYGTWLRQQGYETDPFDPADPAARILLGTSPSAYRPVDTLEGDPVTYRLSGTLDSATDDYHTGTFRVYPGADPKEPFHLDFYVGDTLVESFTIDSVGTPIIPEPGKNLNILIDFRSGSGFIQIVVSPWNIVHQFVIY